ncbi:helix-turn-helix domain-containing protein [Bradyrhizobium sp. UFLA01-814]|uniref:helix-turn-helix domain-containing protein n=1 Tax=Bradyrhizobium sp. UFLA01-814 TaxID=3023480 RepID=UPI00398A9097
MAERAGISRPRYRDIEQGNAAARATTLINVARALGMELMLMPQAMVPGVNALLRPSEDEDRPAFTIDMDDDEHPGPRP